MSALNAIAPAGPAGPDTAPAALSEAAPGTVAETVELPLEGFRIGVTSHRRSQDLIEALERRGAEVLHLSLIHI